MWFLQYVQRKDYDDHSSDDVPFTAGISKYRSPLSHSFLCMYIGQTILTIVNYLLLTFKVMIVIMMESLTIVIASTLFGVQHSGISSLRVKNYIIDRWGKETYSHIFTITSIITFLIAFLSMNFWDWLYFLFTPQLVIIPLFILGVAFLLSGVAIATAASKVISVSTVADMRTDREPELIKDGIYSRIRHPLYLATILSLIALILLYPFLPVIVFSISMIVYTLIGAFLEERKLIVFYGNQYRNYMNKAGFILPKIARH